ncbi:MAG: ethanolamine permease [Mucilaginibacter polytrichastri]|nr:ethanolamine permease [Mucilaginibacter polytrichastri]
MSKPVTITLKKVLRPIHLWAIAVGLVISGEYFGWNYGWPLAGTVGFLLSTILVTVMYVTFIFSFTELTTAIPQAGGPFAYAYKAFGPLGGLIAGYATLIEFVLAPPAIAFALGSYVHFLYPPVPVLYTALGSYAVFIVINALGVKESAVFSLVVTLFAVAELLLFMGLVAPHFHAANFFNDPMPAGFTGVFAAIPFAIWFYLAIEGVAMMAEEVRDPKKDIKKGYIYGLLTLMALALGVMILTAGVAPWKRFADIDYPLPEALSVVMGRDNTFTRFFAGIGLFGLVASFHGTVLAYSRQIYALGRSGYLPSFLARVNRRFQTPHNALIAGGILGCICLFTRTTDEVIVLSVLGAVVLYIISMLSLFRLRKSAPDMPRPFRAPAYPWFPAIALILSVISLVAIVWYNTRLSLIFFAGLVIVSMIWMIIPKKQGRKRLVFETEDEG